MCPRGVSSAQQGNGKALGTWSHLHNPTNCTVWLKGCSWGMSLCKQHDSTAQHCTALPHQVYFALYFFQFGFLVDFVGFGFLFQSLKPRLVQAFLGGCFQGCAFGPTCKCDLQHLQIPQHLRPSERENTGYWAARGLLAKWGNIQAELPTKTYGALHRYIMAKQSIPA